MKKNTIFVFVSKVTGGFAFLFANEPPLLVDNPLEATYWKSIDNQAQIQLIESKLKEYPSLELVEIEIYYRSVRKYSLVSETKYKLVGESINDQV